MVTSRNVCCFVRQMDKPFPFAIASLVFDSTNDICDLCLKLASLGSAYKYYTRDHPSINETLSNSLTNEESSIRINI